MESANSINLAAQLKGDKLVVSTRERIDLPQYQNALEPSPLIAAFLRHPPVGFQAHQLGMEKLIAFSAPFYALTTLDQSQQWLAKAVAKFGLEDALTLPALFVGTTVSEYMIYPALINIQSSIRFFKQQMTKMGAEILILKDLPVDSPLLSTEENSISRRIVDYCQDKEGFLIVAGQALAYVDINFSSTDEYLKALSYSRRKDIRRKLRKRQDVQIEELRTGDRFFYNPQTLRNLYRLYLNVYEQSKIRFDQLTFGFFNSLFLNNYNQGIVFLYRTNGKIIGFNLCFEHEGKLVDKYIGFDYPAAPDNNLYFLSWFHNLEYALKNNLKTYIAGWTDPEVKASLGAQFTFTKHAVYIRNPFLRTLIRNFQPLFESDQNWADTKTAMEAS